MFNELDAIFKFPTLIDIASKKDRKAVLLQDSTLIKHIKLPTEEEQYIALTDDINNLKLINKPSPKVILDMAKTNPDILDLLDPIPDYVHDYIMNSSVDNMLRLYPSSWKLIKQVIYILYTRWKSSHKK